MSVRGYDFTYEPGQATGAPLPGFQQGRWWAWGKNQLGPANDRACAAALLDECLKDVAPPQRMRVTALDMENQGVVDGAYDHAQRERIVTGFLEKWEELSPAKLLIIDWWAGIPPHFNFQQIVKALEGPASKDRAEMFSWARRHRGIVRTAGCVTQLGVIDRPDGGTGDNSEFGTSFYLRMMKSQAKFCREAYPGSKLLLWTCGAYVRMPGFRSCRWRTLIAWRMRLKRITTALPSTARSRRPSGVGKVLSERLTSAS
jgi:hypothetical protein